MTSGIKTIKIIKGVISDLRRIINSITIIILKGDNIIDPSSFKSRYVEELSIRVLLDASQTSKNNSLPGKKATKAIP